MDWIVGTPAGGPSHVRAIETAFPPFRFPFRMPSLLRSGRASNRRQSRPLTLRTAFENWKAPPLRKSCADETVKGYSQTIGLWERYWRESSKSEPALRAIDSESLIGFRDWRAGNGMRSATIDKDLRNIHAVFETAKSAGHVEAVPDCERPEEQTVRKRIATNAEVSRLYVACDVACWPSRESTGIPPPLLWKGALAAFRNWGCNPADLYQLTDASISRGDGSPEKPNRKRWYVTFVRKKTRRKKRDPIIIPLNRTMRRVIAMLRRYARPGGRLFPFPRNGRDIKRTWERIHAEAGIPLVLRDAEGVAVVDADGNQVDNKVYFQDLRKTCNTYFDAIDPGVGEYVLGHAPQGVNRKFYLVILAKRLWKAVRRMKQPRAFRWVANQPRLF